MSQRGSPGPHSQKEILIFFENAFHGRTLLALSLTSKVKPYKQGFGPFAPEIYHIPFGKADRFEDLLINHVAPESVAAVIAGPVQGEGGFLTPPPDFFPRLAGLCCEHGILFIDDEVQSGMGRTGRMFAIEHWKVVPDLLVCAKSLAAGLPLGAVVGRREIMEAAHVGGLGGTFGGNPIACRVALAVLGVFEAARLIELYFERGLVVLSCGAYGNTIQMLMPLAIPDDLLERGLSIIEDCLHQIEASRSDRHNE